MTDGSFRFNAKRIFLTYPQCGDLTKETVYEFLCGLGARCVVGAESHGDGGRHLHAYGEWESKYHTRDPRKFDVNGQHPNIQPVRNRNAVVDYVKKEGDYCGNLEADGHVGRYADLVEATSREEFWTLVTAKYPRDYVLALDKLQAFCEHKFGHRTEDYVGRFSRFRETDELKGWRDSELGSTDRPKALWITGQSRLGKTEWARSLGRHMYYNGAFDLGIWDNEAKYIIFDDMDWKWFPYKKQFIGAQRQFVVTDKYRKKKTINWGKACIVIWNPDNDPWPFFTAREEMWYKDNVIKVQLEECLFDSESVWVEV